MRTYAIYEAVGRAEAETLAVEAIKILLKLGAKVLVSHNLVSKYSDIAKDTTSYDREADTIVADFILTFGGDGTILSAVQTFIKSDTPIMGFNVGKLGFLAEFGTKGLEQTLLDLTNGDYRITDRTALETTVGDEQIIALNDIVLEKSDASHMVDIRVCSNNHFVGEYFADGLIVTTPTGSTAYSLSAGGPVIFPNSPVMCITPVSPHSLTHRPLVVPDNQVLEFEVFSRTGELNLVADGKVRMKVATGDRIQIRKSEEIVKLVEPKNGSFFDVLRDKFLWAEHRTNKEIK
jgi:NAD+ kinase